MKKRGFTLVELLAVIVILAIIALITTVVVINIIETVKIRKYKVEEKSLEKAAELYYTNSQIFPFQDEISLNTLVEKGFINSVKDTGNGSTCEGKVIKDNNGELKGCLKCSNYVTEGCGYVIEQEIKDENPGVICGSGKNEDYDKQTECHIKSVEDLVAFSYLVNNGKTFEGKIVYLDKDLDITNYAKEKSYVDPDKEALYDINGDGEKTSLKDEMTTDKGFQPIGTKPIGTSENNFKGKFEGNAYTISNLMINRPDENYVGLFGYITDRAIIVGLNVKDIDVTGNSYVGGVVGYANSYTTIKEVTLTGTIIGNEKTGMYIGGIVGSVTTSNVRIDSVIVNANVTGNSNVGGISGGPFSNSANVTAIIEGGTITGNDKVYATSYWNTSSNAVKTAYVNSKVKVIKNSKKVTDSYGGTLYNDDDETGNLNLYNDYIDTWLGGDNDGSGYYFDYESKTSNKIVLRSNPINTKFEKGSGTQEDPYLIYNESDMKKIAAMPKERNYYKLMNDIDYNNEHYYMIGTSTNVFSGMFDGGAHTLKNINIYGYNYIGLFGCVIGSYTQYSTITGLNIENIKVKGNNIVGGLAGYINYAEINEVTLNGDVTGNNNIGGIVGRVDTNNVYINSVIVNANVTGYNNVGGISGGPFANSANVTAIIEGGTITGNDKVYATSYWNTSSNAVKTAYVNSKVKVIKNSKKVTDSYGGTLYNDDDETGNLNLYNDYIDTWLGGDNDGSGYYFDYESKTSNKIVLRSNPINTKFEKGSGTQEDPYLIYNESDMKKIAAMPKERNYYKLMNDIDYNNEHYYMIGTSKNQFSGAFEGGAHTLKNINIYGYNNIGMFGNIQGSYTQYSTITGLNVENIKVKGNNYVGGLSGYINYAGIKEVTLTGTIIGNEKTGVYIGGIVGRVNTNNVYIKSIIVNANVTGYNNVGGISGGPFANSANVTAIIEGGTITGNDKVYATSYWNTSSNMVKTAYVNSKVKVIKNSEEVTGYYGGTEFSENYYNNLQYYGNLKLSSNVVVETPYSGDIDASGYYFNYNNDGTDIIVVKTNNSSQSLTTGNVVYTKTVTEGDDKKAPTCTLGRYSVHGNGFTASYTCTDNTKVKARKHIYWVAEPSKVNYEDLISWPSTTDSSSETVSSVWTVESANSSGIEPPSKGSCYYFYYGAQDEAGNTVIYATPNCISY